MCTKAAKARVNDLKKVILSAFELIGLKIRDTNETVYKQRDRSMFAECKDPAKYRNKCKEYGLIVCQKHCNITCNSCHSSN